MVKYRVFLVDDTGPERKYTQVAGFDHKYYLMTPEAAVCFYLKYQVTNLNQHLVQEFGIDGETEGEWWADDFLNTHWEEDEEEDEEEEELTPVQQLREDDLPVYEALRKTLGDHYIDDIDVDDVLVYTDRYQIIDEWLDAYKVPERVRPYIDEARLWNDMQMDGTFAEASDGRIVQYLG